MKASLYNLFIPLSKQDEYILYNTLKGTTFLVNKDARAAIQNFAEGVIDDKLVEILRKGGVLIDDDVDEKAIFKVCRDRIKYSGTRVTFVVLMTFNCNLACPYCYVRYIMRGEIPTKSMAGKTTNLIIKFIKNTALENNYREVLINLSGGEPLLNIKEVFRILDHLSPWAQEHDIKFRAGIISNGTLITKQIINELLKYDTFFQITLDGSRDIHDKKRFYKNGKGTYEDIIESLRLLKDSKMRFDIRVNVDKENCEHIDELLDDLERRFGGGLFIKFLPIIPGEKAYCPWASFCLMDGELNVLPKLWELASQRGFNVVLRPLINYVFCEAVTNHSYAVDPFGDVYKSEGQCGVKELRIGTINEEGKLPEIGYPYYDWMSVDPLEVDGCRDCTLLPACGGGCPVVAYYRYGTYSKGACLTTKYWVTQRIKFKLRQICPDMF